MLRYKRRHLSQVAEWDAEECRLFWNCLPNVSRSGGKVAVTWQNMLKGWRIVGDRMLKCGGVESRVYKRCQTTILLSVASGRPSHCTYKLKWMPCLLLSLLHFIAVEEWGVLRSSLRDFFIIFFLSLWRQIGVYAFIRYWVFRDWLSSIFHAKSLFRHLDYIMSLLSV